MLYSVDYPAQLTNAARTAGCLQHPRFINTAVNISLHEVDAPSRRDARRTEPQELRTRHGKPWKQC